MTASTAPRRVGILGAGMIAEVPYGFLPNLAPLSDRMTIAAIASRSRNRADQMAARFGIPAVYDDLDAMLADADLDIVVNLTPIPAHYETSLRIIEHGVHLVTEKPIAQTLAEADELVAAADTHDVVVVSAPFDM